MPLHSVRHDHPNGNSATCGDAPVAFSMSRDKRDLHLPVCQHSEHNTSHENAEHEHCLCDVGQLFPLANQVPLQQ
jgi:hypothetical protein